MRNSFDPDQAQLSVGRELGHQARLSVGRELAPNLFQQRVKGDS